MPNLLTNIIQGGLVPSRFGLSRWASVDAAQFGPFQFHRSTQVVAQFEAASNSFSAALDVLAVGQKAHFFVVKQGTFSRRTSHRMTCFLKKILVLCKAQILCLKRRQYHVQQMQQCRRSEWIMGAASCARELSWLWSSWPSDRKGKCLVQCWTRWDLPMNRPSWLDSPAHSCHSSKF